MSSDAGAWRQLRLPGRGRWFILRCGVQEGPEADMKVRLILTAISLCSLFLFVNTWAAIIGNEGFSQMNVCTVPFCG